MTERKVRSLPKQKVTIASTGCGQMKMKVDPASIALKAKTRPQVYSDVQKRYADRTVPASFREEGPHRHPALPEGFVTDSDHRRGRGQKVGVRVKYRRLRSQTSVSMVPVSFPEAMVSQE